MDIAATVESDKQRGGGRDESGYSKKQGGGLAFGAVPNCRVLLSALFVVSHADHDCTGTDCAVCHEIHSCLSALRHISEGLGPSAHYGLGAMLLLLCALLPVSLSDRRSCTLTALKIRLNN